MKRVKKVCVFCFFRNYNRGRKKPVSREVALEELLQVVNYETFPSNPIHQVNWLTPIIMMHVYRAD